MRKGTIIVLTGIVILTIASCKNSTPKTKEDSTITALEDSVPIDEEVSEPQENSDNFFAVDQFIEIYNSSAANPITDIEEMDIQGIDYRTEFRSNAFNNAVGKKGNINGANIEILNYGVWDNNSIRIYSFSDDFDAAIEIYTTTVHILDSTITNEEIENEYSALNTVDSANIF